VQRPPSTHLDKVRWVSSDVAFDNLDAVFADLDSAIHLAWLIQPSRNQQATWATNVGGSS
jgi:UDP-glucose 4-epimerase